MNAEISNTIRVGDKYFRLFISAEKIQEAISEIAVKINEQLKNKKPLFIAVLNGSFLFAADLIRQINFDCEISFVKLSSYSGASSSGKIKELIGLNEELKGRTVVVLEDIVDTGVTLENISKKLLAKQVKEIKVAALLFKPHAYRKKIKIDYVGMEIPNDFIIGYGLDYNGLGRNLKDIFVSV